MNRTQVRSTRKRKELDRLTQVLLVVFVVLAIAAAVAVFFLVRDMVSAQSSVNLPGVAVSSSNPNEPPKAPEEFVQASEPMQGNSGPTPEPWDGKSRVTVLVMGLDYRDWEDQNDAPRSDSMILLTMDPINKTAGMLSIPRDIWMDIPGGYGYNKINTAYRLGELYDLPGGGPGLAMETVEAFLGVPVDYYAQIDFQAFERFIDEIEGVTVTVKEEMVLDPVGPAPKVKVEPGTYTLPGNLALAYARNRHTDGDDFTRSERQQEVILAIRDRILSFDMLPTLVAKAPVLYAELSAGIRTNLTPTEVIRLAWLAMDIQEANIKKGVIGPPDQVEFGTAPDGQAILLPVPDRIRLLRDEIFSTAPVVASVNDDPKELMVQEAARISVQNGTASAGLAGTTAELLRSEGFTIAEETNAGEVYDITTIILYNGKPYTANYLKTVLNLPNVRVFNQYDPNAAVDLALILGNDWANQSQQ